MELTQAQDMKDFDDLVDAEYTDKQVSKIHFMASMSKAYLLGYRHAVNNANQVFSVSKA